MPFSATGTFSPLITFRDDTDATAADQNAQDLDIANGLTDCMTRNGLAPAIANLSMGGFKLKNVGAGSDSGDAVNYGQLTGSALTPTGSVIMYAGSSTPTGYLLCDGSAVSRTTYANLFAALGTTWGTGDGTTTFNVPDLRGRAPVAAGTGSGLTPRTLAATGGQETHQLITSEIPAHTHTDSGHTHAITDPGHTHTPDISGQFAISGSGSSVGTPAGSGINPRNTTGSSTTGITINSGTANLQNTGGDGSHNNMQPFAVVNFIIKT